MQIIVESVKGFIYSHKDPLSISSIAIIVCTSNMLAPGWVDPYPDNAKFILEFADVEHSYRADAMTVDQASAIRGL